MSKTKKLVILNLIVAVICVVLYVALIPHAVEVKHYNTEFYSSTVTTIPLSTKKMIYESITLFIVISLPSIVFGVKRITRYLLMGDNADNK